MSFCQFNEPHMQSSQIVPTRQQQQMGIPNEKRQPLGGRKSHKLLDQASTQNLFVTRLPRSLGNDDLLALFAEFRPLTATVMMDVSTGKSKGFGFVTFESAEQGQVALDAMSTRRLKLPHTSDFNLEIKPSTFNGKRIVVESRYVYFRNFPAQVFPSMQSTASSFECEVSAFFSQLCGSQVSNAKFHGQSQPSSSDSAAMGVTPAFLVTFATQAEATAAIAASHGKVLFPELSSNAVMAKYADLTTVKIMLDRGSCQRAAAFTAGLLAPQAAAIGTPQTCHMPPAITFPSHSILSHASNGSSVSPNGTPLPVHHAPTLPMTFWCPETQGEAFTSSSRLSVPTNSPVSSRAASEGGSSCRHSTSTHPDSGAGRYRLDPYNQSGYVTVSSSTSHSSRMSNSGFSSDLGCF